MGYNSFLKIDYSNLTNIGLKGSNLMNSNKESSSVIKKDSNFMSLKENMNTTTDTLILDIIKFECLDWKFQMIYASNIKNTSFPCFLNERAMEMLQFSTFENRKLILFYININ